MIAPDITRRHFLAGAGLIGLVPAAAVCGQATVPTFAPESFGAHGDGVRDDYEPFLRLSRAVSAAGGGTVSLRAGRTYLIDRHISPGNGVTDIIFEGCDGLVIEGNGAVIRMKGEFHRPNRATRGLSSLWFENCRNVSVRNVELDGNSRHVSRAAQVGEAATYGLLFRSCADVLVDGVHAHHFASDGMLVRESAFQDGAGRRLASRRFTVRNSRFLHNARQGLSVIQLRGGVFEACDFSYTGFADTRGARSRYGAHSPAAGVDVEPNNTPDHGDRVDVLTGDLVFRRCRMQGNYGAAFLAGKHRAGSPFLEQVRLEECLFECNDGETGGRDGFIFDVPGGDVNGCTLQMRDKAAFLGWHRDSVADMRFSGNIVYGRSPEAHRRFFALRPTRGEVLVERNRFIGQHVRPRPPAGPHLVFLDNPGAVVRENEFFIPAAAFTARRRSDLMPAIYANAAVMEGNSYTTDLRPGGGAHFGVMYTNSCAARGERFRGTAPGTTDTIRPGSHEERATIAHDTNRPWSRAARA